MWYFIALYDNYKSFACDLYIIMIYNTILVLNHYYLLYLLKVNYMYICMYLCKFIYYFIIISNKLIILYDYCNYFF